MSCEIQPIHLRDRDAIGASVRELWGEELIIVHGEIFRTNDLPGLKAVENHDLLGFLHYIIRGNVCEILTLASLRKRQGIGTRLVQAVERIARNQGCWKLKVTTTNDNLGALAFYQHIGFLITGQGLGLVDKARKLKPTIPEIGDHNIPIHDEIYLEKVLGIE